eukprot:TRINITY_DN5515_c0_g1_i1.p1 TRINITY_DN5515_c0_g1~~TRINITY_DN5515_c0_g1_i1.p1  ORF type:complete len:103 (+),score=10.24 TRINITY_DN5515_c0_g1_i1:600-908(+)
MGFYSALQNFKIFNVFFAAPWIILSVAIITTARKKDIRSHRLYGNMLVKASLSVPFSRLAGATLQRNGWDEAQGYYVGIIAVALIVFLWQGSEIFTLLRYKS